MSKKDLVLRACRKGGLSQNDFQWNLEVGGVTVAPDWEPTKRCGNGLHGFLNGEGEGALALWDDDVIWMVVEPLGKIINLDGKVKFKMAITLFVGDIFEATNYLVEHIGLGYAVIGGTAIAGDHGAATAGYNGTATAGEYGIATAGYNGTATVEDHGSAIAGENGTAIAGHYGIATVGYNGTAIAGYNGAATAGHNGAATAGEYGTAIAGYNGTAKAGDHGAATAGENGTAIVGYNGAATVGHNGVAMAGDHGIISIKYWSLTRDRITVGYIGEDGLLPNVAYKLDDDHEFVTVNSTEG